MGMLVQEVAALDKMVLLVFLAILEVAAEPLVEAVHILEGRADLALGVALGVAHPEVPETAGVVMYGWSLHPKELCDAY